MLNPNIFIVIEAILEGVDSVLLNVLHLRKKKKNTVIFVCVCVKGQCWKSFTHQTGLPVGGCH